MSSFQNELQFAKSPYLLQHKSNPVAWKQWGKQAFEEARKRNIPILVSVGYSTCHWCHVMAHEVFEDTKASDIMNENLICIKVDREENPEIDEIYMEACQAMNGSGGWPLNVFVDHDGKPFFSATYVPLDNWKELLQKINQAWENNISEIKEYSNSLANAMQQDYKPENQPSSDYQNQLYSYLENHFDEVDPDFSGQGKAPRFPSHTLYFNLLSKRILPSKIEVMLSDVLTTIQDSGIHDRVGGGFHRYSTDKEWRLPHFEKMLYDNAQLITTFALAGKRFERTDFINTAKRAANYIIRDMSVYENGVFKGYASAEDADDPEGEGSFYGWTPSQLIDLLEEQTGRDLAEKWNINDNPINIHGVFPFKIPHPRGSDSFWQELPSNQIVMRQEWESLYDKLLTEREKKPRPFKDTKVLSDWNGLALTAMCVLYSNTLDVIYRNEAIKIAEIILSRISEGNIERMQGIHGHLTDYGHSAFALFTAWEAIGDIKYLEASEALVKKAFEEFATSEGIVYSSKPGLMFMRYEEKYDHTQPSGAHSLLLTWIRLSAHGRLPEFQPLAKSILERKKALSIQYPIMVPALLCALWEYENGPVTLTLPDNFRALNSKLLQWTGTEIRLIPIDNKNEFQLCEKDRCLIPVTTEKELNKLLRFESV